MTLRHLVAALLVGGCAAPAPKNEAPAEVRAADLGVAHRVKKGMRAVPIEVDPATRPWIHAGQYVDVTAVVDFGDFEKADFRGVVIGQRISVLAVGESGVTLELDPLQAQNLVLVSGIGSVHLTVRRIDDEAIVPLERVSLDSAIGIPFKVKARPKATYRNMGDYDY